MRLIDYVCFPGSKLGGGMKSGGGDDRYVFDEAAGWACVIDGATDVGPVRIFQKGESDAARFAEIFAHELLANPVRDDETPAQYFARFIAILRAAAEREARVKLDEAPLASLPTAAATWLRCKHGKLEAATLGDTMAIVLTPDGKVTHLGDSGKVDFERENALKVMQMTSGDRLKWLQNVRELHNTEGGYWVFGVQPHAVEKIMHETLDAPPGTRVLVMSDGFYRLVAPYGRYDDAGLIFAAAEKGLVKLMKELRAMEQTPEDDAKIGRFKTSDDATALLFEL